MTFGKMKIPAEVLNSIPLSRDSSLAAANSNTPPTKQKTLTAQSSSMDKSDGEINCFVFFFYMKFSVLHMHVKKIVTVLDYWENLYNYILPKS